MRKSSAKATEAKKSAWTILKILEWTTSYFKSHRIESPRSAAEILLAHALGIRRLDLYLQYDRPLFSEELADYKALIKRRVKREPTAYIIGAKEFWSMNLAVTKDVLIPRPETELLVEFAIEQLPDKNLEEPWNILELGTGSGAISLALSAERPGHRFFASDRSLQALCIAKRNAEIHHLSSSIHFFAGDWFAPIKNHPAFFDMILSNPPYVVRDDIRGLAPEIKHFEPLEALDGGEKGLESVKHILQVGPNFLKPQGRLILEIGFDQGRNVASVAEQVGLFESIEIRKDYSGHDRLAVMKKCPAQKS